MIDERFERSAKWRRQNAEVGARAEAEADGVGDRRALVQAMTSFLVAAFDASTDAALAERASLPEGMAADAERFILGHHDLAPSAWWTITCAVAEVACSPATPALPTVVSAWARLARSPSWTASLFEDACVDVLLRKEPAEFEAWLAALGTSPVVNGPSLRPAGPVSV